MRIYIASDLHIGSEDSNYTAIMEFFKLVKADAGELILLGDILELWKNDMETIKVTEPFKSAYDALIEISELINVIYVCGNHDYNVKKYLKGTKMTITKRFIRGNCIFMHGWEFDCMQVIASPLFIYIMECCPYLYQKFIYKSNSKYALNYRGDSIINSLAKDYAKKNGFTYVIFGHTHMPVIEENIVNCGDFVSHTSYIVVHDDVAELWRIQ